ncbi:MAG: ABC transporter permease [Fimbriimonas ginsengisoli]|uniref:ABC transporter permease n=1 Tax=Fimbriimonas ginsengisoli TaxID=1005039 RepID=A0A931PUG0_FIMGI|nr:ABC transporter permease [Fimbriimonas ginsengisoli]
MNFVSDLRLALRALSINKARTFLTMLGIVIGVAVVILVVAIGLGASKSVADQINSLGTNLLTVRQGPRRIRLTAVGRAGSGSQAANRLTVQDARVIGQLFPETISAVAPQVRGNVQVRLAGVDTSSSVVGTTPEYVSVNNAPVSLGRFFNSFENEGSVRVCVLGQALCEKLTGSRLTDLTGRTILVNRNSFLVIGILAPKGAASFGPDPDDVVVVPLTVAMERVLGTSRLDQIGVSCVTPEVMPLAQQQINALLRIRHHLRPPFPESDDFQVMSQTDLLTRSQSVAQTMTMMLTAVAVISLVVGGIGIMNIMLVSVTERTREIGIRKAVGATPRDILLQFLIEASIIAMIGGLVGVVLGVGSSALLAKIAGWETVISPIALVLALVVSAGVGLFFGIYPASKASRLNPIQALRYE